MRTHRQLERGSVTVWLAVASFVMILLVGLTVDLTGQAHAQQQARDVAGQAARVAGQQIDGALAMRGHSVRVDTADAVAAARTYLASAGVTGSVSVEGGGTVLVVTTSARYQPRFLSIIGLSSMPVSGRAEARTVRTIDGAER